MLHNTSKRFAELVMRHHRVPCRTTTSQTELAVPDLLDAFCAAVTGTTIASLCIMRPLGQVAPHLAMVSHQHHLLGSQHDGNKALRLGRLRGLVNEHLPDTQKQRLNETEDLRLASCKHSPKDQSLPRPSSRASPSEHNCRSEPPP